jgi:hypothetical protein
MTTGQRYAAIWLALGVALLFLGRHPHLEGDDIARWITLQDIVERGHLDAWPYSLILSVLPIPLYWIGRWFGQPEQAVAYFNLIALVIVGTIILFILARRVGWTVALTAGLLLLSASMFPIQVGQLYAEVFTALMVTLGFLLVIDRPTIAAILFGIGVANTPALFPGLILASAWMAWRSKRSYLLALPLPAFALFIGENLLRFGNVLHNPYFANAGFRTVMPYSGLPGFSYPIVFGLLNILLSFGKGLLLFVPGLLAAADRSLLCGPLRSIRVEVEAMLVFVAGMILVYAKWWAWAGGAGWGPRFFLFAFVPAALLLGAGLTQRRTPRAALLLSATVLVQAWGTIQSVLYGLRDLGICYQNQAALEMLCWYAPEFSPLFRQFVMGFGYPHRSLLPFAAWCAVTAVVLCGPACAAAVKNAGILSFAGQRLRLKGRERVSATSEFDEPGVPPTVTPQLELPRWYRRFGRDGATSG